MENDELEKAEVLEPDDSRINPERAEEILPPEQTQQQLEQEQEHEH